MSEIIEVKRGGKYRAIIQGTSLTSCDIVDCKVLFDRSSFEADMGGVAASAYVSANSDFATDFDDNGLKALISIKPGKKLLEGDKDLFVVEFLVTDQAEVGKEYEWKFSQESYALGRATKAGKAGYDIPSEWHGAMVKLASTMQVFKIKIVE